MTEERAPSGEPGVREQWQRLLAFLRRSLHFWRTPLITLGVGALAFGVFDYLHVPTYRSETVILYVERGSGETPESSQAERTASVRLKELLFSRPKLEQTVSKFQLYPEIRRAYGNADALEELKKHVDFRAPGGDTFSIAFEGASPTEAQRVTAELGRQVIDGDAKLRRNQAKLSLDFLTGEKRTSETALRDAEQKLAAFMAAHPRFALDTTPLANGAAIRASMGGAGAARPAAPAWQGQASYPRAPATSGQSPALAAGPSNAPAPTSDADEARARAALAAARENLTEQLTRYTPAHPDVKAAEAAVARADERLASLAAAGGRPAPAAPASAPEAKPSPASSPVLAARAPAPAAVTAGSPQPTQNLVDLETQWLQLTRAVTEARQRQDQIEAQLFRADIQSGSEAVGHGVQVSVIDPAYLPERPLPPGRTTIALIFAAAALVLGLLLALVRAAIDERLFTSRDVAAVTEVLVEVPRLSPRSAHAAS